MDREPSDRLTEGGAAEGVAPLGAASWTGRLTTSAVSVGWPDGFVCHNVWPLRAPSQPSGWAIHTDRPLVHDFTVWIRSSAPRLPACHIDDVGASCLSSPLPRLSAPDAPRGFCLPSTLVVALGGIRAALGGASHSACFGAQDAVCKPTGRHLAWHLWR